MKFTKVTMILSCLSAAVPVAACGSAEEPKASVPDGTGTLQMALTGQTNGSVYRLRNAVFAIQGATTTSISSESDPNSTTLDVALNTGAHTVLLQNGWILERLDPSGAVAVNAALISPNPAAVDIVPNGTSNALFEFDTDGTIVQIGTGLLSIGISVNETGSPPQGACAVGDAATCPSGTTCYPDPNGNQCILAGSGLTGDTCAVPEDCAEKHLCVNDGSGSQICVEACLTSQVGSNTCTNGGVCTDVGSPDFALCLAAQPPPPTGGTCSFADPTSCPAGEACYPDTATGTLAPLCLPAGNLPIGSSCTATNECEPGSVCGDVGAGPVCLEMCDPLGPFTCTTGTQCADTGTPGLGICI